MTKIGIDASPLQSLSGGISYYVFFILDELICLNEEDQFFLFVEKVSDQVLYFNKYSNVTILPFSTFRLGHSIWSQTMLAFACWKYRIDAFWATTQSVPLIKRSTMKTVLTLYDFVYLLHPETMSPYQRIYFKVFLKWMLRTANVILPISKGTQIKLEQFYGLKSMDVISPPIKREIYYREDIEKVLNKYRLSRKEYVITIGTFEPRKNLVGLIKVYIDLLSKGASLYPLVMIGKGGWKNKEILKVMSNALKSYPGQFMQITDANDVDLAYLLSGARYSILVSKYEGYGMPLAESRVCKTATICLDQPEMREATENNGVFLNPNFWSEEIREYLKKDSPLMQVLEPQYESNKAKALKLAAALK